MGLKYNPSTGGFIDVGQTKTGQIIVRRKEQLAGVLRSDKVYFIDTVIDMGTQTITVPNGGLTLEGHGYDISKLYSTEAGYSMFINPSGSYAGNLTLNRNTIYVTGAGSKIFDIDNQDNFGAFEMNTVNLGDFPVVTPSFGTINGFRQIRTSNFAAIRYTEGLTIGGTVSGMAFNDGIILSPIASSTFLKAGVSLNITDGFSSNMNALRLTGDMVFCDFTASNFTSPALMTLNGFRTSATNAMPNIDSKNIKALFKGCVGIDNTFIGGSMVLTTQAVTTITANKTLTKLAGTTTASLDAWFDSPVNNRLRYLGTKNIKVDVIGYVQLTSANTESFEVHAQQWDDSASAWIPLRNLPIETALKILGDRRGGGGIITTALLSTNDYIELWALDASLSGSADPTLFLQSVLSINERQS
jgi:hypothetical protein